MAITQQELDLIEIFQDIGKICHGEEHCGKCAEKGCLVGYARASASECRVKDRTYVQDGMEEIPPSDIRGGYDEYEVLHAIAHLLLQCRACKENHFENCVINVVRSCFEVIELGDEQVYEGDPLSYLMKIKSINEEKAAIIAEEYMREKEKRQAK